MIAFIEEHRNDLGVEPICKVLPIAQSTFYARVAIARNPDLASDRAKRDVDLSPEIKRVGVELGVTVGVATSIFIHLYKSSRPHMAIVGQVPGTEHYRNVMRHKVVTHSEILTVRVDESLYFANARFLENAIYDLIAKRPEVKHVILMCPAVNAIDMSALESIEAINERLDGIGVQFHLSEVKGPVMDRLKGTDLMRHLRGAAVSSRYSTITCDSNSTLLSTFRTGTFPNGEISRNQSGLPRIPDQRKLLRLHGFKVSMSGKGNCYDNAAMETFFKTIKAELIWRHSWKTRRAVEIAIFEYINGFYNPRRKHSALGWESPLAFERKAA
jgi:anti-anti-sigma regulatory factor